MTLTILPSPTMIDDVHLYCRAPAIAIDVLDLGHGVNETIQSNIFEPFFTTKSDGTGLGLALAREMARLNAGDVILSHSSQQGSTFRLYLPTHQAEEKDTNT